MHHNPVAPGGLPSPRCPGFSLSGHMTDKNTQSTDQSNNSEDSKFIVNDRRHWANEDDESLESVSDPEERLPSYVEQLKKEAEEKDRQLKEYIQAYKQKTAETDEFRQRLQRENDTRLDQARALFFKKLVPILDNFNRALESADSTGDLESFKQGVDMIFKQMKSEFESEGVTTLTPGNEPFDPTQHEAFMTEDVDDPAQDGMVLAALEPGYFYKDKLIKPAKVKVAKLKSTN